MQPKMLVEVPGQQEKEEISEPTWLNRFEGCSFQADQKHSIFFEGTDSVFQGCQFFGGSTKTGLGAHVNGGGNRFVGCKSSLSATGAAGLELVMEEPDSRFVSVCACIFDGNDGYGLRIIDPQGRRLLANVEVVGCNFRGNPNGDLHLSGVNGVVITGNTFFFGLSRQRVLGENIGGDIVFARNLVYGIVELPGVSTADEEIVVEAEGDLL